MGDVKRFSHCSHWGAYTIVVEDGRVIGIEPSPHDPNPSPIIQSVKEWGKPERRIPQPLVRSSWLERRERSDRSMRGTDSFTPVSWEVATDLVADEIGRVSESFGNESIFAGSYGWTSCGRFHHSSTLLKRMLNLVGGFTGHVDTYSYAAGPVILKHVLGEDDSLKGKASTLDTIVEHGQVLLVFGSLSPRTAQNEAGGLTRRTFEANLRRIVDRGIKIVHISPLRDDMPDWCQAEWWPVKPNTDTAVLLALAFEVIQSGSHSEDFLSRYCSGSERLLAYLRGESDGLPKNAEWAARISGIDADAIVRISRLIAARRTSIAMSWSLQRAQHGEQPYWAAIALASIIGQIGIPGGGVGFGYASLGGIGGPFGIGKNPSISAGRQAIDSFIPVARIADMLLSPGASYSYSGQIRTYPDTRLVFWAGGNPYHHHQDLNRLSEAWTRPETIIVQDPYFTATAKRADIILPASTSIERNDIGANGRSDLMIAMQQAISPIGQARSDYDIFWHIAEKLSVGEKFSEGRDEMQWLRFLYEGARAANLADHNFEMPDFDAFWEQGWAHSPMQANYTYLADFRSDPQLHRLDTESGKIVLGSELLARLDYHDCKAHPAWIEPDEWLCEESDPERFHLISNQPVGRLHSQIETGEASLGQKCNGREQAIINPDDAARLSIKDGSTVKLWNVRGACLATATIRDTVRPGVVVLPTGAWYTPIGNSGLDISGNPNVLTSDIPSSSFGQGCSAHTCMVTMEAYFGDAVDAIAQYNADLDRLKTGRGH